MSASLVGSEMCIRDRTRPDKTLIQPVPPSGNAANPSHLQRRGELEPSSVSYTHLTLPTICSV
eukprot:10187764-Alexandrium_andersonii.AAC.1